jgi:hypothetical protein
MGAMSLMRRISLCGPFAVLALAVPVAGASAASCSGQVFGTNPQNGNLEVRVSCDTAVTNGTISIGMNRGAGPSDVAAHPTYTGAAGTLNCTGQPQAPGSKYQGIISCTGSLPAQSTANIDANAGPSPCGTPAFAADLSVQFGDGQTFGSQTLPPITNCPGGGGGPGGGPTDLGPGHDFDPGGVFGGITRPPPSKASVAKARRGLTFVLRLGVKGHVVVTIEVGGKVRGRTSRTISGGNTTLKAKLSASGARKLAGHRKRAKIHVEVLPDASEGFTTHGRKYFALTLTG